MGEHDLRVLLCIAQQFMWTSYSLIENRAHGQWVVERPVVVDKILYVFPGLLKFCTVGFCGIGSLVDFILISMQVCMTYS